MIALIRHAPTSSAISRYPLVANVPGISIEPCFVSSSSRETGQMNRPSISACSVRRYRA